MEVTAGVAATRGGSLAMPSPRKEWRAVSEHQPGRKSGDEELGRSNLGQSDERTIYEGREPLDMDFSSITIDGNSDGDFLQQRLHNVSRQRDELQQMEIDLRAQMIARSEIAGMRNSFESQVKEHADAVVKLQEQLHDKEQVILDLEKTIEEKDRELHSIKRDNEAAWAKEDLLREQKKELASFRRERDHSEAEKLQHIKKIHDLQEHLQDKERQLIDMQDQHRVAQETIIYKDEQLREAQAWIARVQEMDALQSQSLQAELRERTEQCHQLWLGWQRQIAEMERFHVHTVQQLQLELADARERSGSYAGEPRSQQISSDTSQFGKNDASQSDVNGSDAKSAALSNGSSENSSIAPNGNMSDHVAGVPLASSSLLGLPAYIPPGQVTAVHPFVMHQQGANQSLPSNLSQSQVSHYQPMQPVSNLHDMQNSQVASEGSQVSTHNQLPHSETNQNSVSPDVKFDYQVTVNGQAPGREYVDDHISRVMEHDSADLSSAGDTEVVESIERSHRVSSIPEQSLNQLSSQFRDSLGLDRHQQDNESKELSALSLTVDEGGTQGLAADQPTSSVEATLQFSSGNKETVMKNSGGTLLPEPFISGGQTSVLGAAKHPEINLLDERSLLACIVRTVPAGGRIRISSTLPNRLGKMLAPLHWHDYKRKYGKLDDFVGSHPELFVIEGDYIQLREGAQEMIAAKAAVAKVAAAAVASAPHSSNLPSVAVTPMAQAYRPKGFPSTDGKDVSPTSPEDPQLSAVRSQHPNGVYGVAGTSTVKILSKSRNPLENGLEGRVSLQSATMASGSGANFDRSNLSGIQINKRAANGRPISNFIGKPMGRASGSNSASRR